MTPSVLTAFLIGLALFWFGANLLSGETWLKRITITAFLVCGIAATVLVVPSFLEAVAR